MYRGWASTDLRGPVGLPALFGTGPTGHPQGSPYEGASVPSRVRPCTHGDRPMRTSFRRTPDPSPFVRLPSTRPLRTRCRLSQCGRCPPPPNTTAELGVRVTTTAGVTTQPSGVSVVEVTIGRKIRTVPAPEPRFPSGPRGHYRRRAPDPRLPS